jgi:ribosomal subunit interface protein
MDRSESVEAKVRERAAELEKFDARITSCRVVIEAANRRHQQGRLYHVRVDIGVPGGEIVVKRNPAEHHAHEDVYVAVRDAFDAARRQIEDHVRRRRGDTKSHGRPGS